MNHRHIRLWRKNTKKAVLLGFSFTEVMITISLFLLLAGVGVGAYFKYYTFALANADIDNALTLIKQARFHALKNSHNSDYGVHLDIATQSLTIFRGTYIPVNPENTVLELEQLRITDLSLNPNVGVTNEILFEKQTGKTQNAGNFTIENDIYNYTFTINSQGVVN